MERSGGEELQREKIWRRNNQDQGGMLGREGDHGTDRNTHGRVQYSSGQPRILAVLERANTEE